jgi:hypothetical protein
MNVYVKALIPTIFVFLIGIMIGVLIENYRLGAARKAMSESEINWNDAQLLNSYLDRLGISSCDLALEQNLEYNNKIYKKGLEIEEAIKAEMLTPETKQEWRRYVLLQIQFWFNSIELKEKCNFSYYNVAHIYRLENLTKEEAIDTKIQSSMILGLKEKCGKKMMLIPLTADLDLIVVDTIVKQYNITKFPAIIINEEFVFQGLTQLEELEEVVKC